MELHATKIRLQSLLLVIALVISFGAQAQKFKGGKTEQEVEQEAFTLFEQEEYTKAMPLYEELLGVYPQDPEYNYYLGVCQVEVNDNLKEAIKHLKIASVKNVNSSVPYFLARAFHMNYQFHSAIRYYQKFKENYRKKAEGIDRLIEMCQNGIPLVNTYAVIDLQEKSVVNKKGFFRNYQLTGFEDRIRKKSKSLEGRYDEAGDKEIASTNGDGSYIYFSSFGKNKKTGRDLYRAPRLKNGGWGAKEPLVSLNTQYDELYPFMAADDRTLYFCSQGHNSMGGFDVFRSVYNEISGTWTEPENLGFPFNSTSNDLFFACDSNDEYASFSSSRENGKDDFTIYKIKLSKYPEQKVVMDPDLLPEIAVLHKSQNQEPKPVVAVDENKPLIVKEKLRPRKNKYRVDNFPYFNFRINKDLVYHNLREFQSDNARSLFLKAKNDEFYADSLSNLTEKMRARLGRVSGKEKDKLAIRISSVEQKSYSLTKASEQKFLQSLSIEREYLSKYVIGEVNLEANAEGKKQKLVMASEVLPVGNESPEVASTDPQVIPMPVVDPVSESGFVYHIQIGAFSNRPSQEYFKGVGPILEEKVGNGNVVKYMVGNYRSFTESKTVLPDIRQVFPNAFVVAYRDGKKTNLNQAIKATDKDYQPAPVKASVETKPVVESMVRSGEKIEFRVQVGAFSSEVPGPVREKLHNFSDYKIGFTQDARGYTICSVGAFSSYKEAADLKLKLREAGLSDAFTVAYEGQMRIPVKRALELLRK
ncbi:MAG: hypothetical protein ACEPOZ_00485 [Marinifilaceae bacterium]